MQDVGSLTGAPANLVELKAVSKSYDNVRILNAIDLTIRDGEFITLLGPSGSGKTTILRIIGGFTHADSGQILLGGREISDLAINRRPFNTVFQDYALFPHMRVFANIAYGLRVRGSPSAETERRVAQVLDLVQLSGLRDRYPSQLSGGQRQRVALARAIICEPRLILLDEPLAALDVALRRQMQQFLKSIQREIRTTFLFVTHDQEEAITMSDRICVMDRGQIIQTGSAQDLYYRPGSAFVAGFFGDNNLIEARIAEMSGSTAALDTAIGRLLAGTDDVGAVAAGAGAPGFAMIRPEAISIAMEDTGPGFDAVIDSVEFGGASTLVVTRALAGDGTTKLRIRLASTAMGSGLAPGRAVRLHWSQGDCRLVLP